MGPSSYRAGTPVVNCFGLKPSSSPEISRAHGHTSCSCAEDRWDLSASNRSVEGLGGELGDDAGAKFYPAGLSNGQSQRWVLDTRGKGQCDSAPTIHRAQVTADRVSPPDGGVDVRVYSVRSDPGPDGFAADRWNERPSARSGHRGWRTHSPHRSTRAGPAASNLLRSCLGQAQCPPEAAPTRLPVRQNRRRDAQPSRRPSSPSVPAKSSVGVPEAAPRPARCLTPPQPSDPPLPGSSPSAQPPAPWLPARPPCRSSSATSSALPARASARPRTAARVRHLRLQVTTRCLLGRGGGIRTHGLFVPNEARYQAAPHPGGPCSIADRWRHLPCVRTIRA